MPPITYAKTGFLRSIPSFLLIDGISMRNGEGEKPRKQKNLERNRNRNREREREKFGREERIDEADTGQRYVRRIENRDSPRVMPHTRILTLIVC